MPRERKRRRKISGKMKKTPCRAVIIIGIDQSTAGRYEDMTDEAFERGILDLTETLYRVSYARLWQRADRDDAVQETLKKAWEKRKRLRDDGKLKSWLIRILLNECHNIQRRGKRVVPSMDVPMPQAPPDADKTMHDLILSLPEKYRMSAVLIFMEGMTAAQAAKALGIPQGTVHSRVHRARQILKEKWEEAQKE